MTCGRCEFCTSGRTNLCRRGGYGIGLGRNGGLAEFVDAPVGNLAPIPDGVDAVTASLTEPLAVALRGVGQAGVSTDSTVLVLGAGTIGLCAALAARDRAALGAITARHPHQRAAAEAIGVTVVDEAELAAWAKEHRPDIVIESVGGTSDTAERRDSRDSARWPDRDPRLVRNRRRPIDLQQMMTEGSLADRFVLLWHGRT